MRSIYRLLLVFLVLGLVVCSYAQSPVVTIPRVIKFSGTAPSGVSSATFAIYDSEDGMVALWLETQSVTADDTGHYTVLLGATKPDGLPASIFASGEARWIGVKLGDAPESARSLLVSVPYALKAGDAETLGGKPLSAFLLSDSATTSASNSATGTSKAQRLKSNAETGKANPDPTAPGDSGTQNHLAKFMPDGVTLGDSALVEIGGRLGIGTTFPNFPLELVGSNVELLQRNPNPSGYSGMRFYNDQNNALHALEIDYSGSTYPSALIGAGPVGEQSSITNNGPFPMTFGTNNVARVTIAGSGNVGIGTNNPGFPLELVGSNVAFLQRNPNATAYTGMRFYNDQNSNVRALEIDYSGSNYAGALVGAGPTGESASLTTTGAFPLTLGTSNTARILISAAGNVGINNIAPAAKLDVAQPAAGAVGFTAGTGLPSGIHADTTATSGFIASVFGTTSSADGYGILGENLATGSSPNLSAGVRGITDITTDGGVGIWGDALQPHGDNVGVFGRTASDDPKATGVIGEATSQSGDISGVYGLSHSLTAGIGVFGETLATSAPSGPGALLPAGVYGLAHTAGEAGLFDVTGSNANMIVGRLSGANKFRVDGLGNVFANSFVPGNGADFAESVSVVEEKSAYEPGDVMAIDTEGVRRFAKVSKPYSTLIAGIYSTKPGVLGTPHDIDDPRVATVEIPLAVVGIVPCKVSNENGDIKAGDLLVSSSTAGYAMKGTDRRKMTGAVVGKALQSMHDKTGVIEVLVSLQ